MGIVCPICTRSGSQIDIATGRKLSVYIQLNPGERGSAQGCPYLLATQDRRKHLARNVIPQLCSERVVLGEAHGKAADELLVSVETTHLTTANAALGHPSTVVAQPRFWEIDAIDPPTGYITG